MMRTSACAALLGSSLLLSGCAGLPVWGNLFAMAMSLAIFLGTLGISRDGGAPPPGSDGRQS